MVLGGRAGGRWWLCWCGVKGEGDGVMRVSVGGVLER